MKRSGEKPCRAGPGGTSRDKASGKGTDETAHSEEVHQPRVERELETIPEWDCKSHGTSRDGVWLEILFMKG